MPWSYFLMLSFKPAFSLSSFTFIKRLFSFSSLSIIRVVASAYLRLLTLLPEILISTCASFSPAFCMMSSTYKLNKQNDNTQPRYTPFPILNQSAVPCSFLMLPDPHIDFSRGRSGGLLFSSLSEFSTVCCDPHSQRFKHSQCSRSRCFSGILLLFLWSNISCNLISCSSVFFSKSSLNIWKLLVCRLLKSGLENFEHYFANRWKFNRW